MLYIEKVIKLMDDYHYAIFYDFVKNLSLRSYYPLVLVECIDRDISINQNTDALCEMVYLEVNDKTKKKFLQLAHYTFKLTSHLSKNYPAYLKNNIHIIQKHINEGKIDKGIALLEILLDVCEKIEDFSTYSTGLKLLAHHYNITENKIEEIKTRKKLMQVLEYESSINKIYLHKQEHFSIKGKALSSSDVDKILNFYKPHHKSKSQCIRLLSKYFYLAGLNYFKTNDFFKLTVYKQILSLEKQLDKFNYIIFPFLEDLSYHISYLKLRYLIHEMGNDKIIAEAETLLNNSDGVLFWKNYVNVPEIFSIAVQTSHFVSNYMLSYQDNHLELLSDKVKKQLNLLKKRCQKRLHNRQWEETATVRYINLVTIYAGLLLLGTQAEIKEAIQRLEGILYTYQQLSFHAFIDPIFTVIIMGHFCLKQYNELETSYRRYRKLTNKKVVNAENNLTIHAFFYVSKWLVTKRTQYIRKLKTMILEAKSENRLQGKIIISLVNYYEVPIEMPVVVG